MTGDRTGAGALSLTGLKKPWYPEERTRGEERGANKRPGREKQGGEAADGGEMWWGYRVTGGPILKKGSKSRPRKNWVEDKGKIRESG